MIYAGTDLKFLIDIKSSGFKMDEDDFDIVLTNGRKKVEFTKDDLVHGDDGWYLCFNSSELGSGDINIIVYAYVPDSDFDDGIRTEVYKDALCRIEGI